MADTIRKRQAELQAAGWYEDFREVDGELGAFTVAALISERLGTSCGTPGRKLAIRVAEAAAEHGWSLEVVESLVPHLCESLAHGDTFRAAPEEQGLCALAALIFGE